jgi:hypothetical protein
VKLRWTRSISHHSVTDGYTIYWLYVTVNRPC